MYVGLDARHKQLLQDKFPSSILKINSLTTDTLTPFRCMVVAQLIPQTRLFRYRRVESIKAQDLQYCYLINNQPNSRTNQPTSEKGPKNWTATPAGLTPCHRATQATKPTPSPHHNTKSQVSRSCIDTARARQDLHSHTSGTVATPSATPVPPSKLVMSSSRRRPSAPSASGMLALAASVFSTAAGVLDSCD